MTRPSFPLFCPFFVKFSFLSRPLWCLSKLCCTMGPARIFSRSRKGRSSVGRLWSPAGFWRMSGRRFSIRFVRGENSAGVFKHCPLQPRNWSRPLLPLSSLLCPKCLKPGFRDEKTGVPIRDYKSGTGIRNRFWFVLPSRRTLKRSWKHFPKKFSRVQVFDNCNL